MLSIPSRAVALALVVAVLLTACSGTGSVSTVLPSTAPPVPSTNPAVAPSPPTIQTPAPPIAPEVLASHVGLVEVPRSGGAVMAAVLAADGGAAHAVGGTAEDPGFDIDTPIRIASITKVLTALVVLGLVDEGRVDLDAPASTYVTRVAVPDGVTVRDLLHQTSGIPEFTEVPGLVESWFTEPDRVWTPEEVVALVDGVPPAFAPGSEFHWGYSNTNYVFLGVLIEEVEARPFHQAVRARLLDPLGMDSTYLEGFEDGPAVIGAFFSPTFTPPAEAIDFPYTSIATSAWAAGGLVSTARDLHILFSAAFDGTLISDALLQEMFDDPRSIPVPLFGLTSSYGLGMQVFERVAGRSFDGLVGHIGDVPGYVVIAAHHRPTGTTMVWAATSNLIDPSPMLYPIAEATVGR